MKKIMTHEIITKNDVRILFEKRDRDSKTEICLRMQGSENCRLHWGLSRTVGGAWKIPAHSFWPPGSIAFGESAVQTPFIRKDGENRVTINVDRTQNFPIINFVLFYPHTGKWDNNAGKNYYIKIHERERTPFLMHRAFKELIKEGDVLFEIDYEIDEEGTLSVAVIKGDKYFRVMFITDIPGNLALHWGVAAKSAYEWTLPPESVHPEGTKIYDDRAAQTAFRYYNNLNHLILSFSFTEAPAGIPFVLTFADEQRWLKDHGQNFYVPVNELLQKDEYPGTPCFSHISREIIKAEMGRNSWTLMHRFNSCYDLLDRTKQEEEGLALLFVWLRYSFLRQLDWQRNYNTKPRELSHAQDRLTMKLAGLYSTDPEGRELIRLILSTLGRGGEGQRIRDEILQIMHRHRIKEVAGHFLEEWHQKLHNNATPDDIEICKAYLEFLRSNGNRELFYQTLESGGVTKERLESFERPIVSPPDFVPHLKDSLIHDFEQYLKLLRSVHSGTDLDSAAEAAGYLCSDEMRELLNFISQHRDDRKIPVEDYAERITTIRGWLNKMLDTEKEHGRLRDALYLDIALEEFFRVIVERHLHRSMDKNQLVELVSLVLRNTRYAYDNFEFSESARHWDRLRELPRFNKDWSLHAKSILDRLGRAISDFGERYYTLFQSKAEFLGKAFHADAWVLTIFSEEVIRGRLSFVLSMLLRRTDPLLREYAELGDWQVISPGQARGQVEIVDVLQSVQGNVFERPTIIVAEEVRGDEEPPEGVQAIITPDTVDLVSHVAIRARNAHLLFATCYDSDCFERLRSLKGHLLDLTVNAAGDVVYEEVMDTMISAPSHVKLDFKAIALPDVTAYAVSSRDFRQGLVGGKAYNLIHVQRELPDWIHSPPSVALPFGVFEKVLSLDANKNIALHYDDLLDRIEEDPVPVLAEIRKTVLTLEAPGELFSTLRSVMEEADLGWPENWDAAWLCIKRVWASKWNERAYFSRRARGISHEELFMAVLIQQVIEAEYSFVIHTVNPYRGDKNELYAEIVRGLGETLVGNYPGRALGFTSGKTTPAPEVIAYPSKSIGMFGGGLIFRSDSNGEDLAEYAGAGLYDSILLEPATEVSLKYSEEPLVWNEPFRKEILTAITELGIAVEKAVNSPQDIEGAYKGGRYYIVQTRPQV